MINKIPQAKCAKVEVTPTKLIVGSLEYSRKNERRFELIKKKVAHGLTPDEEEEFNRLQAEILSVTKQAFPYPQVDHEKWVKAKEEARETPDSPE